MNIITVLVVSISPWGFVPNQVQYNMERAQYEGARYHMIIIDI